MLSLLKYPVIQAPMAGGFTPVDFVSAVSNLGALGSFGAAFTSPDDLRKAVRELKTKTRAPFNINLFTCKYDIEKYDPSTFCDALKKFQKELPFEVG